MSGETILMINRMSGARRFTLEQGTKRAMITCKKKSALKISSTNVVCNVSKCKLQLVKVNHAKTSSVIHSQGQKFA